MVTKEIEEYTAAPVLAHYLYGKAAADLNADEKATISSITSLVGAGVGASSGTDSGIAQGAKSAGTAVDNNWMSPLEYQRRQELVDKSLEKGVLGLGQRELTLEEAREFIDLVEKDAYADKLLGRYQADSSSLSPQETQTLALILEQVSGGDPELALRILDMPIADGKVEDSYVSELYSKALQQVGVYESMDMRLAQAAEPALYFISGPVGAVVRGVSAAAGGYSIGQGSAALADGQLVDGSMQMIGGTQMVAPVFAKEALSMGLKTPNSLVLRPVAGTGSKGIRYEPALTDAALLVKAGVTDANVLKAVSNAKSISTAKGIESTVPRDLWEQSLWRQVIINPGKGKGLQGLNNDPRFLESAGFKKMAVKHELPDGNVIEIHYQYNKYTDKAYDIKMKSPQRSRLQPGASINNGISKGK
ncbi:VENN motif pre-toxin domain-containing protein [Oligella ureolytica]|uniref:VENN motif pre-toxin domain-containing protein n=1 Tax=Oligella ureolytica TaxID=90244 RepID=UPI002FBE9A95